MNIDLLAIVNAEQEAEAIVREAQERRLRAVQQAIADRAFVLSNLKPPVIIVPDLAPLRPNLERIRQAALQNRPKVVRYILEELHA